MISREAAVAAACAIIDEHGLDGPSLTGWPSASAPQRWLNEELSRQIRCSDRGPTPSVCPMAPTIREATHADVEPAVRTLAAAFADYPFTRHTIADDNHAERLAGMQRLFVARIGLPHGRVWVAPDADGGVDAVAVWTTPDSHRIGEALLDLGARLRELAGERAEIAQAAEASLEPHRPRAPVWFLGTVGVHPEQQGRGLGRAVIEPDLRAADAQGVPCYLETSLAGNVALYRKLGFEVTAEVDLPNGGPTTWTMSRPPPAA